MPRRARVQGPELAGVFDWVKKTWRRMAPPPTGALIPRPPEEPATRLPSIFDVFRPSEPSERKAAPMLPSMFEAFRAPAAPPEPAPAPLIFAPFKPEDPEPLTEPSSRPPRQDLTLWEALFEPPTGEAAVERPISDMFAGPPPGAEPVAPAPEVEEGPSRLVQQLPQPELRHYETEDWHLEFPDILRRTQGRMPLWVAYNLGWSIPSTMELVEQIRQAWDLPMIFETALNAAMDPYWKREAAAAAHTGEPATLEIEEVGAIGDPYRNLFRSLGVPDHVVDFYAQQADANEMLTEEIFAPLLERVGKAMEILKPPSLKGWFVIGPSIDEDSYWLKYKEAAFPSGQQER